MTGTTKTKRQQVEELMIAMQEDMKAVATELREYIAGPEVAAVIAKVEDLQARCVPATQLDAYLQNIKTYFMQAGLYAQQFEAQLAAQAPGA